MSVEGRGWVTRVGIDLVNWQQEEPAGLGGRRQPSGGGTSRMSREAQVRICERLGVQLPGPTRRRYCQRISGKRRRKSMAVSSVPGSFAGLLYRVWVWFRRLVQQPDDAFVQAVSHLKALRGAGDVADHDIDP